MKTVAFNRSYAIYAIILFLLEAWIAIIFKTGFIRHTFGDYIVVILLYCILKSFINLKPTIMVTIVVIIAFGIEFLQRFNLLEFLGLENNQLAILILGSTFHISDFIAYTLGGLTILIAENKTQ